MITLEHLKYRNLDADKANTNVKLPKLTIFCFYKGETKLKYV